MQSISYIPEYRHARNVNVGGSGFSWHPFANNANYGEERGYKIANMDAYVGSDKESVKQIILNQEATFRSQVQELHRLYRRQKELMDEMRVREIFALHLQSQTSESIHSSSHARPEFSQTPPHATSWFLGDHSRNVQRPSYVVAESSQDRTTVQSDIFIRRNSYNEGEYLLSSNKGSEKRIVDLELPARMYHDDQGKQFKAGNSSDSPLELTNFQSASGSDFGSVKTGDLSSFDLKSRKRICFIDLNEPIDLESLSSSSSGHFMEIKGAVSPSDGINSSVTIDLNSMPFSETEINVENVWPTNTGATVVVDHSSVYNHELENEKCVVKTETKIDLNTGMGDENPPPLQIKPAEDTELEGPVSPENEECSPPRGESEDIQVETLEIIAAQTLVTMFSSGDKECTNPASLCWFAEIVSSIGDDLENQIMKLENDAADKDQVENALTFPRVEKEKESGPLKRKAGKRACGKRRKCPKLSPSDVAKKSMSSILKQPATPSKQGVMHGWGTMRKRQGGRRRRARASEFVGAAGVMDTLRM